MEKLSEPCVMLSRAKIYGGEFHFSLALLGLGKTCRTRSTASRLPPSYLAYSFNSDSEGPQATLSMIAFSSQEGMVRCSTISTQKENVRSERKKRRRKWNNTYLSCQVSQTRIQAHILSRDICASQIGKNWRQHVKTQNLDSYGQFLPPRSSEIQVEGDPEA